MPPPLPALGLACTHLVSLADSSGRSEKPTLFGCPNAQKKHPQPRTAEAPARGLTRRDPQVARHGGCGVHFPELRTETRSPAPFLACTNPTRASRTVQLDRKNRLYSGAG